MDVHPNRASMITLSTLSHTFVGWITFTILKQPSSTYEQYSVATLAHAVLHGSYKPRHGVATPADSEEWAHCCGTCTPTPHKLCSRTLVVMVNKPWQRITAEVTPHDNCCNLSLSFLCLLPKRQVHTYCSLPSCLTHPHTTVNHHQLHWLDPQILLASYFTHWLIIASVHHTV